MQITLVRHPRPMIAAGHCYGASDIPPCPEDLLRVRDALLPLITKETQVWTSPLRRCAELAKSLSSSPRQDPRLAELDFGRWEGLPWQNIAREEIDAWASDIVHYRPGGGESLFTMAERVQAFWRDLPAVRCEQAVVICHAGTMRLLAACARGLSSADMARVCAETPHDIAYGDTLMLTHKGRE